jgi:hypothetical protein
MCALAEHLSQSEIELPLRNTCYYSPLAEVGVSSQTEMKNPIADRTDQQWDLNQKIFTNSFSYLNVFH